MAFIEQIKKEINVQRVNFKSMGISLLSLYIFGFVVSLIVIVFSGDDYYVPIGGIVAATGGLIFNLLTVAIQMLTGFNLAVSMNISRKRYFSTFFATSYTMGILYFAGVVVLLLIDKVLITMLYPHLEYRVGFIQTLGASNLIFITLGGGVAIVVIGMFIAAVMQKWGVKAFWSLWVVWMFGFTVLPRMIESRATNGIGMAVYNLIVSVVNMPGLQILLTSMIAILMLLTFSWQIFKKAATGV